MTIEEIRKGAPKGAKYYLLLGALNGIDIFAYYTNIGEILLVFDGDWVQSEYNYWQLELKPLN